MKYLLFSLVLAAWCSTPAAQTGAAGTALPAAATPAGPVKRSAYDFARPAATYTMPPELAEVSGIALAGPGRLAAIEDETGTLYFYNLRAQRVEAVVDASRVKRWVVARRA